MRVLVDNRTDRKINLEYLESWIVRFLPLPFKLKKLFFILVSDEELLAINKTHLDHDFYTDIISFDYTSGNKVSGECWISLDRVIENAEINKVDFTQELNRVFCHGVLHFVGFNDKTEEDVIEMRNEESRCLEMLDETVSRES